MSTRKSYESYCHHLPVTEGLYALLVEHAQDGIIVLKAGVLEFANPKFVRMTGYDLSELRGEYFTKVVAPGSLEPVEQRHLNILLGKEIAPIYKIDLLTRDGREVSVEANASIIEYNGEMCEAVIMRDIGQR